MTNREDNFSDAVSNMELLDRAKKEFNRDRKLVIKNLPADITEEEIRAFLEDYFVNDVTINKQQNQAVVTMEESDSVLEAVDKLRDATLLYTQVTLRVSSCDSMLCVAQLPLNLTEWMFREAVAVHGAINKSFLLRSEYSGESKGYGFVEFSEPLEKIGLIKTKLDWSVIEGNTVHCDAVIDRTSHGLMFDDLHSKCLLIDNLPTDYKDPIELRELFSKFHKPVYCQIVLKEGESLGFGIIEYAEAEHAEKAFNMFSNHKINDTSINLSYCIPGMSAVHMFNRVMFKYGDRVKVNKASLHSDPVYPNPAFLKHNFFKLMVGKFPRLLVHFTDNLIHLQQGYVHQLETHTNAKPGLLGPAPNIPMSPLMDMHLQLGLLCLVILDLKKKNELEGEVPEPLGKLRVPTLDEANKQSELPSLLGDPMTAQADIVLKNIILPSNDIPDYPPLEKSDEPRLLGRPIRKLSLAYVQRLGSLMAMLSEKNMSKGILGNAPIGPPRPLMENLISPGMGNNTQAPKSLLGEIPGKSNVANAANFMGAVKALAFQKLMESPANNKNQILSALFGGQGNKEGGGGGGDRPQSLLGKPPPLMGLGGSGGSGGQDRMGQGDGLLPVPDQGQGYDMSGDREDYGYDDYGGYDDMGYQEQRNRSLSGDKFSNRVDRGYGGAGYGGSNDRFGMNPGYGGPDSGYGDNGYSRSYGSPGMNYGPGGGGLMGEYNGGRMGDKPYMGTPSRKNMGSMYGGMSNESYNSTRNTGGTGKDQEYDSIAQQAAAYAASTSAAYNQYDNYRNYMAGYNSGYNNSNNSGYGDSYDSGYNRSGYGGPGWGGGGSYGSYGSASGSGVQGYNSSSAGYGRSGAATGSGSGSIAGGTFSASQGYGASSGYGSGAGYGRDGTGGIYSGAGSGTTGAGYGQDTARGSSQGSYPGNTGSMKPPLPPGPLPDSRSGLLGTPQGQKRNSNHFIPSPEPSPEGDYIGQHSQGLGGHYADTYAKRQRLNSRFGAPY